MNRPAGEPRPGKKQFPKTRGIVVNAIMDSPSAPISNAALWVEPVGKIILARIRGAPTTQLLQRCQQLVRQLQVDTGCNRIMYDALELERPTIDVVLEQQVLTGQLMQSGAKIAIVVPNTAIAYLARLAFGEATHRVFYSDISAAVLWLNDGDIESRSTSS